MRALIGHYLGEVDPLIYSKPELLGGSAGLPARSGSTETVHEAWLRKFESALKMSREDFVAHHNECYDGVLPVWVAVEVMDWGMLSHLYRMAPNWTRKKIADVCQLTAPQMESWLKCLNILRNYSAHHARLFNRVFDIKPKLSRDERFNMIRGVKNRVFGQLTLLRYLHAELDLPGESRLPEVLGTFPHSDLVPFSRIGAPADWYEHSLWI